MRTSSHFMILINYQLIKLLFVDAKVSKKAGFYFFTCFK